MIVSNEWVLGILFLGGALCGVLYFFLAKFRQKAVSRYGFALVRRKYFFIRTSCLVLAWALLAFSFMRPRLMHKGEEKRAPSQTLLSPVDEVLFVLDVSRSMSIRDVNGETSRLDRAKQIIERELERLEGIHSGLLLFSGDVMTAVPPTLDFLYLNLFLDDAQIDETGTSGTDILRTVEVIAKKYADDPFTKRVAVIIVSDGEDSYLVGAKDREKKEYYARLRHAIVATPSTLRFYTVGVGKKGIIPDFEYQGKKITSEQNSTLLEKIADEGHGKYYNQSNLNLESLADELTQDLFAKAMVQEAGTRDISWKEFSGEYVELYYLPLVAAVLLLMIALGMPEVEMERRNVLFTRIASFFVLRASSTGK